MKPNVLVFIDWYYPGFKAGGPVRSCINMVQHLKDDFQFYIVTSNTEYTETVPYKEIEYNTWCNGLFGEKIMYLDSQHRTKKNYISLIIERKYSSVMIMGIFSKEFSILPLKAINSTNISKVFVSPRGMLAPGALKIKGWKKRLYLAWANLTGFYAWISFHVSNKNEADQVRKNIKRFKSIEIADNFPRYVLKKLEAVNVKEDQKLKLISVARIAPEKNTLFALEVLSHCKAKVSFDLYGSIYDINYWDECKKRIKQLPSNIRVEYKGDLASEKLFDVLPKYDFLFLPTRGENFGHIILESFMCGVPVIISNKTPWTDLSEKGIGIDLSLEDKSVFSSAIDIFAYSDSEKMFEMRKKVLEFGNKKSNASELKDQYKNILK